MARRAFVVGSQTAGLRGATGDARRMAAALGRFGFTADLCVEQAATRAGILEGYRRLIEASGPDDAALFYYSGHGALAVNPHHQPGSDLPPYYQCIVPVDIDDSAEGDFRGIAAQELSLLLADLTARTRNAVVVLDCCHSAGMCRDLRARPKALPRPLRAGTASIKAHVDRLVEERRSLLERLDPEGNPDAVRLFAAGTREAAWEYERRGESVGVMTESLLLALEEARGHVVTWDAIGDRVRERVLGMFPAQRPDLQGPGHRLLFERREAASAGSIPVVRDEITGRCLLRAGRIHGVHVDDELAILGAPAAALERSLQIGTARVTSVAAGESELALTLQSPEEQLPEGACAFPVRSAAPRRAIRIDAPPAERRAIAAAIAAAPLLRVEEASAGESAPILAAVRVDGGQLDLLEPWGQRALPPVPFTQAAITDLVANLQRMAAAQGLRELRSAPTAGMPEGAIAVEWGYLEGNRQVPLDPSGELLAAGTPVYIRVRNTHPGGKNIHVSMFDIGLSRKITQLTRRSPSGVELAPGAEYVFGRDQAGGIVGVKLSWPGDLPADEPRLEEIVIIAAEQPHDLSPIAMPGLQITRGAGRAPLDQLAWQIQRGGPRDREIPVEAPEGYVVRHIELQLSPDPAAPRPAPAQS